MYNYSENWRHLKSILVGYANTNRASDLYSYSDHTQAKALSILLANATLATPKLDRATVDAVLRGRKNWPNTLGMNQFEGVSIPLSLFEEYGFVAFYAGWCTVHCNNVEVIDDMDPSLIPVIQAVQHLKSICYGRDGYVRPHYIISADKARRLLAVYFGDASVKELLQDLCPEGDSLKIPPGNQYFSSLVSTYLWLTLRETLEPEEAFERWILCLRVNCDWAMPVTFDDVDIDGRSEFSNQLIAYLAKDPALNYSTNIFWKQEVNRNHFSSIAAPVKTQVNLVINTDGSSSSEHLENIELEKPNLAGLGDSYSLPNADGLGNLHFVQRWHQCRHWQSAELFYGPLLASTLEASIRIDGNVLTASNYVEDLVGHAASRPILKLLLFILLPEYERVANYIIFLLSRPSTCDVALFYLTQKSFSNSRADNHSYTQHFDKGYQQLVCLEYLRTIEEESDSGGRLLEVVELIGGRCGLHTNNFLKSFEYQFLFCLLDSLSPQQVIQLGQIFIERPVATLENLDHYQSQHHCYLLGFWLIEHLEGTGIDSTGTLIRSLKAALLGYYKAELEENLSGRQRTLKPNTFFSALPWHKFIGDEGVGPLLALSNNCSRWELSLNYCNQENFAVGSAIRHYLQVLMCVGQSKAISGCERVASRVAEIARTLGFGSRHQATYLFDVAFYSSGYDLWAQFCSYTNLFQDSLYDDFTERCMSLIPLDQLFVLLERCNVTSRGQKIQDAIASRGSSETEDLGLHSLEKAFISACDSGHTGLAHKLIGAAKAFLAEERFARTNNPSIVKAREAWLGYEYKLHLLSLLQDSKSSPDNFAEAARKFSLPPDEDQNNANMRKARSLRQECERFRRYIIAAAYCETDPRKCVDIMESLYKETNNTDHSFMLFKGRVALKEINKYEPKLRQALSQFLGSIGEVEPEQMRSSWIAIILDTLRQLNDAPGINAFWLKLTPDQQAKIEIMRPYCKALIARGEALIAQQIINRHLKLNQQAAEEEGLFDLFDELRKALPSEPSISQYVQIVNEGSQRSAIQLAKHYGQIMSKGFEDYVSIVAPGQSTHEFLKNAVLDVVNELLLRKKNLRIHSKNLKGCTSSRITKEDLINDWFTSLFDKRMADARVGLRDQKRGGQSASGKSPGEVDGYITDAKNKRIAIFEAFRLFSLDTKVIFEHLDKIAGYDNESVSPVFIVAYCDVGDFSALVQGYAQAISTRDYVGFTIASEADSRVEIQNSSVHLWVGMEWRRSHNRKVIFYHFLLNMAC